MEAVVIGNQKKQKRQNDTKVSAALLGACLGNIIVGCILDSQKLSATKRSISFADTNLQVPRQDSYLS